jgi:hypothetical protein
MKIDDIYKKKLCWTEKGKSGRQRRKMSKGMKINKMDMMVLEVIL